MDVKVNKSKDKKNVGEGVFNIPDVKWFDIEVTQTLDCPKCGKTMVPVTTGQALLAFCIKCEKYRVGKKVCENCGEKFLPYETHFCTVSKQI